MYKVWSMSSDQQQMDFQMEVEARIAASDAAEAVAKVRHCVMSGEGLQRLDLTGLGNNAEACRTYAEQQQGRSHAGAVAVSPTAPGFASEADSWDWMAIPLP